MAAFCCPLTQRPPTLGVAGCGFSCTSVGPPPNRACDFHRTRLSSVFMSANQVSQHYDPVRSVPLSSPSGRRLAR